MYTYIVYLYIHKFYTSMEEGYFVQTVTDIRETQTQIGVKKKKGGSKKVRC